MNMNQYENHICELRINMREIIVLAVCFQLKQLKKQPKKIQACPVQAGIFFRLLFQLLKLKAHCEDHNFTKEFLSC